MVRIRLEKKKKSILLGVEKEREREKNINKSMPRSFCWPSLDMRVMELFPLLFLLLGSI
jgi:hypothetical protein